MHLTKACTGKAAEALGHWLEAAWKLLQDKFNDVYTIKQALARQINELPKLVKETYDGLSHLSNTVQSVIRQVESMGQRIDPSDTFMLHQILIRLPRRTIDGWEQKRSVEKEPTINEHIAFIEARARGCMYFEESNQDNRGQAKGQHGKLSNEKLTSAQANVIAKEASPRKSSNSDTRQQYKKRKGSDHHTRAESNAAYSNNPASTSAVVRKCKMCTDSHPLWECQAFKAAPIKKRTELIDQWGLCRTCLKVHEKGACKFRGCKLCDGALHNSLLCPQGQKTIAQVNMMARQKAQREASASQTPQ